MIDQFLEWITGTPFAIWVQSSVWGYQIILTLHSIGLGFLVGLLLMIDVRILGFARRMPIRAMHPMMMIVWSGFVLNAITGVILFAADADRFFHNTMFRFKLLSILIGMILAVLINHTLLRPNGSLGEERYGGVVPGKAKLLATLSIMSWLGAIIFGRLIAYHG